MKLNVLDNTNGVPVDTGLNLNLHEMFRRRPGRFLNVKCTFSLRPVSTGVIKYLMLVKTNPTTLAFHKNWFYLLDEKLFLRSLESFLCF